MKVEKSELIAIIGVSSDENKYGYKIFKDLLENGYNVVGVNPKGDSVLKRTVYKNLDELTKKPDLVITVVPPVITEKVLEKCARLNINKVWMQPGSESDTAIKKAKDLKIEVIHNACFMVQKNIW